MSSRPRSYGQEEIRSLLIVAHIDSNHHLSSVTYATPEDREATTSDTK
ncbi:MAG TPA: hypothetical protein VFO39_05075 [Candidatus Sulfotelmatobacter sp.]|nr:hypothetical protein [Candidatus Sulfotelmatobacter sp.]